MEGLNEYRISLGGLILLGIGLLLLYFALRLAGRLLGGASPRSRWLASLQRGLRYGLIIFEPLAILVWCVFFVFRNPPVHALLLGLLFLGGFVQVRSYLSGLLLRLGHAIGTGKSLRCGGVQGSISEMGTLGLYLQADEGLHYLSYAEILNKGYTMLSGEEIAGVYQLAITREEEAQGREETNLMDLLATSPYLDWNHKPERLYQDTADGRLRVKVAVKQESQLQELIQLLHELGYICNIISTK